MPTAAELTQDDIAHYREMARKCHRDEQKHLARREECAWDLAREAAQLLRMHHGAGRVVVFGSLVRHIGFTAWSDVDIAAWGIAAGDTFRAIGAVMDLSAEIDLNLVDVGSCSPSLLASILQEGIDI